MKTAAYSTAGFTDRPLPAALRAIAEAGFRRVEVVGRDPHLDDAPASGDARQIREWLDVLGFEGVTVHAPMGRNVLGASEEAWRREAVAVFEAYIALAAGVGASTLVVHAVPNPQFLEGDDPGEMPERMRSAVVRSLDELVPVAQRENMQLLLENLPYRNDNPYLHMQELRPLVDAYPEPTLGLIVDTGHAWTCRREPAEEILIAGSRLGGMHLQDVDGEDPQDDHWVPTHGSLDWGAIRAALIEVDYAGPWTFEVGCGRHGETPEELAAACRTVAEEWGLVGSWTTS